jgi:hypothetical protein
VVSVATSDGLADTDAMPAERVNRWALVGVVAGVMGLVSALVQLFRG